MQTQRRRRPSPELFVAIAALFFALGGTAGAVVTAAVPLAKRALVADKAKVANTAKVATTAKTANSAKTALTATLASNANLLGFSTSAEIIASATTAGRDAALAQSPAGPRPASTAAGLLTVRTGPVSLNAVEDAAFVVSCAPGETAVGGGYSTFDPVISLGSFPTNNGTAWHVRLAEWSDPPTATTGDVYVTCLK
jgi:hypothetical protein